jgi:hypothetical protein
MERGRLPRAMLKKRTAGAIELRPMPQPAILQIGEGCVIKRLFFMD